MLSQIGVLHIEPDAIHPIEMELIFTCYASANAIRRKDDLI